MIRFVDEVALTVPSIMYVLAYPHLFDRRLGLEVFWEKLSSCEGFMVCGASYPFGAWELWFDLGFLAVGWVGFGVVFIGWVPELGLIVRALLSIWLCAL